MISYMSQITVPRSKQRNFATTQSSCKVYISHSLNVNIKGFPVYLKK